MLQKIGKFIKKEQLLAQGDRLLVGVSGGADSMCLLLVLCELQKQYGLFLHVVHVHHGIRAEEADHDAEFVRTFCEERGISCVIVRVSVPELAREQGIGLEEAGRQARYEIFEQEAKRVGAGKIALAHHRDDQAETVLFRMLRGTGIRGLRGMQSQSEFHGICLIRPMLTVSREDILSYLAEVGQDFCTDSTNESTDYSRNYIRNRIMPELVSVNAQAGEHLTDLAEQAADWWEWMQIETDRAYAETADESGLQVLKLVQYPRALRREMILRWFREQSGREKDWTNTHVQAVEDLLSLQSGREAHVAYGMCVVRDGEYLRVKRMDAEEEAFPETIITDLREGEEQTYELPDGSKLQISLKPHKKGQPIEKNKYTKWFDYGKIDRALVLRTRRSGDYLVIAEDGKRKLLQNYFVDIRMPREERERVAVLAMDSQILWVPGLRNSENCRVDEHTQWILVVKLI